jgi:transcriptional regulator with XRE-family HTH domain
MNTEELNVLVALPRSPIDRAAASSSFCLTVNGEALRHEMHRRGLTCRDLARRAKVAPGTISRAVHGGRLHPAKLRAILEAIHASVPLPGLDVLVAHEDRTGEAGVER